MGTADVDDRLTKIGWAEVPSVGASKTIKGSDVAVNLGISSDFGGVGVKFEIVNLRDHPTQPLDVLEARSAAGCGWQTAFHLHDPFGKQNIDFNQAAGNSVAYQWGYNNDYDELAAFHWNPVPSDATSARGATSPFDNNCYLFEDGRLHIGTNTIYTRSGTVVDITNQYCLRSRVDQYWDWWAAEQAFYLNKRIARERNLRVYLVGASRLWSEGPILPYDNYVVKNGQSSCDPKVVKQDGCGSQTDSLSFALFIWDVFGMDIGVAIIPPNESCYGHLNMCRNIYGPIDTDDSNGSIDWHTVVAVNSPVRFPAGSERPYHVRYIVGTVGQLADLGYKAS